MRGLDFAVVGLNSRYFHGNDRSSRWAAFREVCARIPEHRRRAVKGNIRGENESAQVGASSLASVFPPEEWYSSRNWTYRPLQSYIHYTLCHRVCFEDVT